MLFCLLFRPIYTWLLTDGSECNASGVLLWPINMISNDAAAEVAVLNNCCKFPLCYIPAELADCGCSLAVTSGSRSSRVLTESGSSRASRLRLC